MPNISENRSGKSDETNAQTVEEPALERSMHDLPNNSKEGPDNTVKAPGNSSKKKNQRSRAAVPSDTLRNKRVIAYPVHADESSGPPHWTLGILVNKSWDRNADTQADRRWSLLHFDTAHCNSSSESNALAVAKFIAGFKSNLEIEIVDVPVPKQPALSNDCGLYPAHFLKIFLSNIDKSIEECTTVSILRTEDVIYFK